MSIIEVFKAAAIYIHFAYIAVSILQFPRQSVLKKRFFVSSVHLLEFVAAHVETESDFSYYTCFKSN